MDSQLVEILEKNVQYWQKKVFKICLNSADPNLIIFPSSGTNKVKQSSKKLVNTWIDILLSAQQLYIIIIHINRGSGCVYTY